MGTTASALEGFVDTPFTWEGKTRSVFVSGSGPAVIVIAEMPGITPAVFEFARRVEAIGTTVVLPHLFGVPGKGFSVSPTSLPYTMSSMIPACISREFHVLATGKTSPVMDWLRALARHWHEAAGGPGVGVVGMCFTGGFALGMVADAPVLAPVLSQPSLPIGPTRRHRRDLGLSPEDLAAAKAACAANDLTVLGLRFTADKLSPPERFERLREELGDRFVGVEIDSSKGNPWGHRSIAHSVLTTDLVDEPGHPTREALDAVLDLLRTKLLDG